MVTHAQENVISNIAPLSKVITIDVPFILGETVLPVGAFFENIYKASRNPRKEFREKLKADTEAARYRDIDPIFKALAERELALESARLQGICVPELPGYGICRGGASSYYYGFGYSGMDKGGASKNNFIDDVRWEKGSQGEYTLKIRGPIKGARVLREHEHGRGG